MEKFMNFKDLHYRFYCCDIHGKINSHFIAAVLPYPFRLKKPHFKKRRSGNKKAQCARLFESKPFFSVSFVPGIGKTPENTGLPDQTHFSSVESSLPISIGLTR